jgi:hypothetical protein
MRRRSAFLSPVLLCLCSCSGDGREMPPLDLLVVDAVSGAIIERWEAPEHTFDVKQDPASGRVFGLSESGGPSLWEFSETEGPRRVYELDGTDAYPFGEDLPLDLWFDRGHIAIDPVRRRIAFTSPRSDRTVLMDIDTEDVIAEHVTWPMWHSVAFDRETDTAYATGDLELFSFRISDGTPLDENLCFSPGNEDWANTTTTVVASEAGRELFAINGETFLCSRALSGSAATPSFSAIECGVLPCGSAGVAVNDSASRLFIANSAAFASFPADPGERLPSVTFWDRQTGIQTTVPAPAMPHGLALTPDESTLFVSSVFCNRVGVYDPASATHLYDIPTEGRSWGMDFAADGTRLFVTQFEQNGSGRVGDYGPGGRETCPELAQ